MATKKPVTTTAPAQAEKSAKPPAKKITRPPQIARAETPAVSEKAIEKFIESAPDSTTQKKQAPEGRGLVRGKREQISHTIPPDLLDKVDALAKSKGLTRAGLINFAISEYVNK